VDGRRELQRIITNQAFIKMNKVKFIVLFGLVLLYSCSDDYVVETVGIQNIDTAGIHLSYEYLEEKYSVVLPLDVIDEDFYSTDSLKIKFKKSKPDNVEVMNLIRRNWEKEEVFLQTDDIGRKVYDYHSVDVKPLFLNSKSEFENDLILNEYFKEILGVGKNIQIIGAYILVTGEGRPVFKGVAFEDDVEVSVIRDIIEGMPSFTTPIHKGDTVTVSYLIEVPLPIKSDRN